MEPEIYIKPLYKFHIRRTLLMSIYVGRAFANIEICLFVLCVFFSSHFFTSSPIKHTYTIHTGCSMNNTKKMNEHKNQRRIAITSELKPAIWFAFECLQLIGCHKIFSIIISIVWLFVLLKEPTQTEYKKWRSF